MAAAGVVLLVWFTFLVEISAAVNTQQQQDQHAPFSDLHEIHSDEGHKIFSKEEVAMFDGKNPELPIYIAIKGVVFDVTTSKDFYGPGKPYNVLTGKDASRAIEKWSMSPENLNENLEELTKEQLDRLETNFHDIYMKKYPVVGYMRGHEPRVEENLTWGREDL